MKSVIFLIMMIPLFCFGADFNATVQPSAVKVHLDDSLYLNVTLRYPDSYYSNPEVMVANLLERGTLAQPPFAFVGVKALSKQVSAGKVEEVIQFELDPQVVGNHPITFFAIPFYPKDPSKDKVVDLISSVFNVQVIATPAEANYDNFPMPLLTFDPGYPIIPDWENSRRFMDQGIEDLAPINQNLWNQKQIPWLSIAVILLISLFAYFILQKPRQETAEQRAFRARKEALKSLEELRQKRLPQVAQFEAYYIQLTDTIRHYLEAYYNVSAPTQTTREFLADLSKRPLFDEETQKNLKEFLVRSDLVKFAQYMPSKDECAYAEIAAKKIISPSE